MREVAGKAGQTLLDIQQVTENKRSLAPAYIDCVNDYKQKLKSVGIEWITARDLAGFARPMLDHLQITPSPTDMEEIGQALLRYVAIMAENMEKFSALDFSTPKLAAVAPPLPKRKVA